MSLKPLTLKTLGNLDGGRAEGVINAALQAACTDLEDRGSDRKKRKVVITIEMELIKNGEALASVQASTKVPQYRTDDTVCVVKFKEGKPSLQFQPQCPENPEQSTMFEE